MGNLGVDTVKKKEMKKRKRKRKEFIWRITAYKLVVGIRSDFPSRNTAFPITARAENIFQGRRSRSIHPNAFSPAPSPTESNGSASTGAV